MLREKIIEICPILFAGITILYVILKLIILKRSNVKTSNYSKAFIRSLLPVSKQERKNMTNTRLANYYTRSNDLNLFYYIIAAIIIGLYLLMSSL